MTGGGVDAQCTNKRGLVLVAEISIIARCRKCSDLSGYYMNRTGA